MQGLFAAVVARHGEDRPRVGGVRGEELFVVHAPLVGAGLVGPVLVLVGDVAEVEEKRRLGRRIAEMPRVARLGRHGGGDGVLRPVVGEIAGAADRVEGQDAGSLDAVVLAAVHVLQPENEIRRLAGRLARHVGPDAVFHARFDARDVRQLVQAITHLSVRRRPRTFYRG